MTNYLAVLAAALLAAGACSAAEPPAVKKPAAPAAASVAAAPAGTQGPGALPHYVQAPAGSNLTITFEQAGAASNGSFKQFATELTYDEKNLAASGLKVTVQIGSIDTQDKDRDTAIAGEELFDTAKYPTAQYAASSLARGANGVEAVGKLTLRGVTRDLRLPLTIRATAAGLELAGATSIKRLDYGVGQGEWKSTETVGDEVKVQYKVALVKAK
jgi:polyisoprenoid-binding protein YceI